MTSKLKIDVHYGRFGPWSNSIILETDNELALIDAQFMKMDAALVVEKLKSKGKPLAAVFLTHSHPDHVWGASTIVEAFPGTPVYAQTGVAREIDLEFRARQLRMLPLGTDKIPSELPPISVLKGEVYELDGHPLQILEVKPAETPYATAFYLPERKTLISGDLLYNQCHYYVAAGLNRPELWIDAINDIQSRVDIEEVIPGHGLAGGTEILDQGLDYLEHYIKVAPPLTSPVDIRTSMLKQYPDYHMDGLLLLTREPAITHPQFLQETGGKFHFGEGTVVPDGVEYSND